MYILLIFCYLVWKENLFTKYILDFEWSGYSYTIIFIFYFFFIIKFSTGRSASISKVIPKYIFGIKLYLVGTLKLFFNTMNSFLLHKEIISKIEEKTQNTISLNQNF